MNTFPEDFIWGTAASSYQIEGATSADGRSESIWDRFCKMPGKVVNGDSGDIACDHYHKYAEDLELVRKLGVEAYRFSCAWPRIVPDGSGKANQKGIDFYNRIIDTTLEKGMSPWLTLYHWDLPQCLQDKGGWTNRDIINWFENYAGIIARSFGDRVNHFMVLNEPSVTSFQGHLEGSHAPGLTSYADYASSVHHQNLVIGNTYRQMKAINPSWEVGSTYTHFPVRPAKETPEHLRARDIMDAVWNTSFFDPLFKGQYPEILERHFSPFIRDGDMESVRQDLDFIGVQHYSPTYAVPAETPALAGFTAPPSSKPVTGMGWSVDPEAFYETLVFIKDNYRSPRMVITENGAAYKDKLNPDGTVDDRNRVDHYNSYIAQVLRAIEAGCRIDGYFAWSFMDNFEWAWGYDERFGLVYVDYETQKRIPKMSYYAFSDIIKNNGVTAA